MGRSVRKLDTRETVFVTEYLVDLDPKRAAIAAGYSATMAASKAYQWVSNGKVKPHVFAAVAAAQLKRSERTAITADRVLAELAKIGFADIRGIFTDGGSLLSPTDMSDEMAAAVSSVEVITRRTVGDEKHTEEVHKIKLNDKLGALTQIGRHLGMFTDRTEHSGNVGLTLESLVLSSLKPDAESGG